MTQTTDSNSGILRDLYNLGDLTLRLIVGIQYNLIGATNILAVPNFLQFH